MIVNNVDVRVEGISDISEHEIENYITYLEHQNDNKLGFLSISAAADGQITLDYELASPKFERIRRITGYLVGTTDRWNNAKRAEEHERVKHGVA